MQVAQIAQVAATIEFRAYSAKSKALRALTNKGIEDVEGYLYQVAGKWGFDVNDEGVPSSIAQTTTALVKGSTHDVSEGVEVEQVEPEAVEPEVVVPEVAPVFAAIAQTLAVPAAAPAPAAQKAPRPEANGVKRPGAHTLCGAIWAYLDALQGSTGNAAVSAAKQHAATQGWDSTTIVVQFYRWRKFNGIVGRQG